MPQPDEVDNRRSRRPRGGVDVFDVVVQQALRFRRWHAGWMVRRMHRVSVRVRVVVQFKVAGWCQVWVLFYTGVLLSHISKLRRYMVYIIIIHGNLGLLEKFNSKENIYVK